MTTVNHRQMLQEDDLIPLEEWILDFLDEHEWASPHTLRVFYSEREGDVSRQWVSERLKRLVEHGHVGKVHPDTHDYQLVDDPRQSE